MYQMAYSTSGFGDSPLHHHGASLHAGRRQSLSYRPFWSMSTTLNSDATATDTGIPDNGWHMNNHCSKMTATTTVCLQRPLDAHGTHLHMCMLMKRTEFPLPLETPARYVLQLNTRSLHHSPPCRLSIMAVQQPPRSWPAHCCVPRFNAPQDGRCTVCPECKIEHCILAQ